MTREVARLTKWAWEEGMLVSELSAEALAELVFVRLKARYPQSRAQRDKALFEINKDIKKTLRVLNYGR